MRSFVYAGIATVLGILLGYPLAYAIAQKAGRWKNLLLVCVVAPMFTSFLVRTLAWKTILSDNGWLVGFLRDIGILGDERPAARHAGRGDRSGSRTTSCRSWCCRSTRASNGSTAGCWRPSSDLYASPARTFFKVTLPLSMPGLVAGTLLFFIPAAGDYINAELLGTPNTYMIGNVIDSAFLVRLDYPQGAALSFLLMAVILVLVFVYVRRAGTDEVV